MTAALLVLSAMLAAAPHGVVGTAQQAASARALAAQLASPDASVRTKAACELRELGDRAVEAMTPLVALLADASPVDGTLCGRRWSHHGEENMTSPGEEAAAALVAIGSRSFDPLVATLKTDAWVARRNAAWALGALDEPRAVPMLTQALRDREAPVRQQAAWALGAIDDRTAVPAVIAALDDEDARVRRQAAWALGALDDSRAVPRLSRAVSDTDEKTRSQAAWALGAIDDHAAVEPLMRALTDSSAEVREQAAWALGAIGDSRATPALLSALKDQSVGVRRQAAWAIGVLAR